MKFLRSIALIMFVAVPVLSQQTPDPAPPKLFGADVTASVRARAEAWDWFDTSLADGNYSFFEYVFRFGIGQRHSSWDWKLELEQPTLAGLPSDAIARAPQGQLGGGAAYFASNGENAASVFLKQGYVRLKGFVGDQSALQLGRFEFIEGQEGSHSNATVNELRSSRIAHRLIGNFSFSDVGRSFDGLQFTNSALHGAFDLMGARATPGVYNVDGLGELDTDVIYGGYTHPTTKSSAGEWRFFGIGYHDGRLVTKTDNRALAVRHGDSENIRIGTFGGDAIQTFKLFGGTADLLAWGAWQTGSWGMLAQRAGALSLEGGYQFNARWKPWIRGGYTRGTGDSNSADRTHGTFFQILPTPRIYARFPFFNMMNNQDLFSEFIFRPSAKLTFRSDVHSLWLSNAHDLWYQGGGAYENATFGYSGRPSGGSDSLATMFDVSGDYKFSRHWSVTGYFADAQGKTVVRNIYPNGSTARFGYGEVNWTF